VGTIAELGENLAAFEDKTALIEQGLQDQLGILSNQRADLLKMVDAHYQTSISNIELLISAVRMLRGVSSDV
jgi:hypothetical protein